MWMAIAGIVAALISGLAGYSVARSNRAAQQETNEMNLQAQREANATNVQLAGEANQWQSEEWLRQFNMTNAFNLPSNQVQRLRDAGLNPALAMTNGALVDSSASQGSTPSANLASVNPFRAIAPQMSDNWLQSMSADTALKVAQASNLNAQTEKIRETLPLEVQKLQSTIDNLNKDLHVKSAEISKMSAEQFYLLNKDIREGKYLQNDTDRVLNQTRLTSAQIDRLAKENQLTDEQISRIQILNALSRRDLWELQQTFALRLRGLDLSNQKLLSEIGLNEKRIEELDNIIEGLGYDNTLKTFDIQKVRTIFDSSFEGSGLPGTDFLLRVKFILSSLGQFLPSLK